MRVLTYITGIVLFLLLNTSESYAQKKSKLFRDSTDNAFDMSKWLLDLHGFLPLVVPITEPALGYGAVAAGVYFIPKKSPDNKFRMPDIVGAGGGYTQNGSWFAGGGYAGFWKDDKIRYRGIAGYGSINLKFYGIGDNSLPGGPVDFTINSFFFLQQGMFRIKESNFMMGGKYVLAKTRVTNFESESSSWIDPSDIDVINSGLGIIAEYESFNNILSPSKGLRMHLEYTEYLEFLGSDRNNGKATFFTIGYIPILTRWNLGLRFESNLATESTPFYMKPYLSMRGLPIFRYLGDWTVLGETEQFVNVYKRWSLTAFGGYGIAMNNTEDYYSGTSAWNAGAGFRYLIARILRLQMGVDVARGPEDWAFYIVFGNAWLK